MSLYSKLTEPKDEVMGTSNSKPVGQKHKWQPGLHLASEVGVILWVQALNLWDLTPSPSTQGQSWVQFMGHPVSVHWKLENSLVVLEKVICPCLELIAQLGPVLNYFDFRGDQFNPVQFNSLVTEHLLWVRYCSKIRKWGHSLCHQLT